MKKIDSRYLSELLTNIDDIFEPEEELLREVFVELKDPPPSQVMRKLTKISIK